MSDSDITPVVFRIWKPSARLGISSKHSPVVIALFPAEPADYDGFYCSSFELVGGHGAASIPVVISQTRPATPEEYAEIKEVLEEKYEYHLKVYQRVTPQMDEARRAEARRLRAA